MSGIQNNSNTVSGKVTDKDETAKFPLASQVNQAES